MQNRKIRIKSLGSAACVIFFCLIGISMSTTLYAELSVSLELSDIHYLKDSHGTIKPTVFVGDSFELKAVVSGATHAPDNLTIKGLEQFLIQGQSSSSNISINNSSLLAEKTTVYTMLPKKTGTFVIGPATVRDGGKTYTSHAITIHVSSQNSNDSTLTTRPASHPTDDLFCRLTADKQTVVTEEPVTITVSIYRTDKIPHIRGLIPPKFPDCTVKEITHAKEYRQHDQEKTFIVTQKQYLIFPKKPGQFTIPPAQAVYTIQEKRTPQHTGFRFFDENFFSDLFPMQVKQKVAASNPLSITVNPLPAIQEHIDGVGSFRSFVAKIDKTKVVANEPMKFTLELTGHAHFDLIFPPTLSLPQIFKTYDSKTELTQDLTSNHSPGTKSFEFIFQIPQEGAWTIPAQSFHYFDTQTKTYKTIQTEPIPITVSIPKGAQPAPKLLSEQGAQAEQKFLVNDIHFIEEHGQATQNPPKKLPFWSIILLMLIIPILFYLKKIIVVLAPLSLAFTSRKNTLVLYQKKLVDVIEYNEFEKLYSLFIEFFSHVSEIPIGMINEETIAKKLEENGLPKEKIDSFLTFLTECAQYSFASKEMTNTDLQTLQKRASYWLLFISQTLKR